MIGTETDLDLDGLHGRVVVRRRGPEGTPRRVVLLAHGYGEHSGRYAHVLDRLAGDGAVVYAPDHLGHARSDREEDQLAPLDATRPVVEKLRDADLTTRIEPGGRHDVLNETTRDEILDDLSAFVGRVAG